MEGLHTAEEVAAMREDLGYNHPRFDSPFPHRWSDERIVATLEALMAERDKLRALWKQAHEGWGETLATSIARGNALAAAGLEEPE